MDRFDKIPYEDLSPESYVFIVVTPLTVDSPS